MKKKFMAILSILCFSLADCATTVVGGGTSINENGNKVSADTCMGSCVERAKNAERCYKFSEQMAKVCSEYLTKREAGK